MPLGSRKKFNSKGRWHEFLTVYQLFDRREKSKLFTLILVQMQLAVLDLLGVLLIGVIGSLAIRGVQSKGPGDRVGRLLELIGLENAGLQIQVSVLGLSAATLLVMRTAISVFLNRRSLYFLSYKAAKLSSDLLRRALDLNLVEFRSRSSQDFLYALTSGINVIILGVVATLVNAVADFAMLIILTFGLFLVDPSIAMLSAILFASIGVVLHKILHRKAVLLGERDAAEQVNSSTKIIELFQAFREYSIRNRKYYAFSQITESRYRLANISAEKAFLPMISKYVFESALVVGSVLVCAAQFSTQDASRAFGTIALFLATGGRIAPGFMRIQQSFIMLKNSIGSARITLEVVNRVKDASPIEVDARELQDLHKGFKPFIEVDNLTFYYVDSSKPVLENVSMKIRSGESAAIIGSSGSGKSTLADILIGVLNPKIGSVKISGLHPSEAIAIWPGAIGYVPQEVFISNGSVKDNVCLGFPSEKIPDSKVWSVLDSADLVGVIEQMPQGLHTIIGDGGQGLSGGQRQRLGIARALLSKPKLLILDEATSALDTKTERSIQNTIEKLKRRTTLIIIAHRFSTIANSENLFVLEKGRILDSGNLKSVVSRNRDLSKQFSKYFT